MKGIKMKTRREKIAEDVWTYGLEAIIMEHINDFIAIDLIRAFIIATTERLSGDDYNALIEEVINIYNDEQMKGE